MSDEVIASLQQVSAGYDTQPVLANLAFTLQRGDRVGISGPTGTGKSSLLLVMLGLKPASSGEINWFGKPCRGEADFQLVRRRVGLMFQDPDDQLFCPTVIEDVAFGPKQAGTAHEQALHDAQQVLQRIGIGELANRACQTLSFGQKRLACLAGLLISNPDVILLDEPTNGLDRTLTNRLLDLVMDAVPTSIVVSHDLDHVQPIALSRWQLQAGQLVASQA